MDTDGNIQEHSEIKLTLYKYYLEGYLSVLLHGPFKNLHIVDVCAGPGISNNGKEGSALIAAKTIQQLKEETKSSVQVRLHLNDASTANFANLQKHLAAYKAFTEIKNLRAQEYLKQWNLPKDTHSLLFIDPHGYTQVTAAQLKELFAKPLVDFLIFIPLHAIYRFLREGEEDQQLKPIADFLSALGIGAVQAKNASTVEAFGDLVVNSIKKVSGTPYVYKQMLETKKGNQYGLVFISNNPKGAQKFLEAQLKVEKLVEPAQLAFAFVKKKPSILESITFDRPYTNSELYELGLQLGILPSALLAELRELERQDRISLLKAPEGRKRGAFYLEKEAQLTLSIHKTDGTLFN